MSKMFVVKSDMYPLDVLVYFGDNFKLMRSEVAGYFKPKDVKCLTDKYFRNSDGMVVTTKGLATILWMPEEPTSILGLSILNHEIYHVACFILKKVGIECSRESEETYAYFLEFLTKEIYSQLDMFKQDGLRQLEIGNTAGTAGE